LWKYSQIPEIRTFINKKMCFYPKMMIFIRANTFEIKILVCCHEKINLFAFYYTIVIT
jgi:hypothetical protein